MGAIEQAILTHPSISEASVVGIPDLLKEYILFAFVQLRPSIDNSEALSIKISPTLFREVNKLVREQTGAIASLSRIIQGQRIILKTRSGKILRRVLRDLVEQAVVG